MQDDIQFSPEQMAAIKEWVMTKAPDLKCPACGKDDFSISDRLLVGIVHGKDVLIGGRFFPPVHDFMQQLCLCAIFLGRFVVRHGRSACRRTRQQKMADGPTLNLQGTPPAGSRLGPLPMVRGMNVYPVSEPELESIGLMSRLGGIISYCDRCICFCRHDLIFRRTFQFASYEPHWPNAVGLWAIRVLRSWSSFYLCCDGSMDNAWV